MALQEEKRGRLLELGVVVLLVGLACALSSSWWVNKTLPLHLDGLGSLAPWVDAAQESNLELAGHEDALWTYPWFRFLQESAQSGESLLWYPLESLGYPFYALWDTRVASPFSLPFYGMELHEAFRFSVLLKLLLAMLVAYYTLRRLGFSGPLALFGAVSYGTSGIFLTAPLSPLADTLVWVPLWLLVLERFALGHAHAWTLGALILALLGFSGAPEGVLLALLFAPGYLVLRKRIEASSKESNAFPSLGLAVAGGLGLLAVQGLPWLESVRHLENNAGYNPLVASDWSALFVPGLGQQSGGLMTAIGGAAILLLPLWFSLNVHVNRLIRARTEAAVLSALMLALITGFLSFSSTFSGLHGASGLLFLAFPLVLLAVNAAEDWVHLDADQVKQVLKRLVLLAPACWVVYALFALVLAGGVASYLALIVYIVLAVATGYLFMRTLLKPSEGFIGVGLAVISLLWGLFLVYPHRPQAPESSIYPETGMVQSLDGLDGRIGGQSALAQWPLAGNGIESVRSASGIQTERYGDFLSVCDDAPLLLRRAGAAGLVLTKQDIQGPYARVRPMLQIKDVYTSGAVLFKDLEVAPRARMIYEGAETHWPSDGQAMAGPQGTHLVEDAVIAPENPGPMADAQVLESSNTAIKVQVKDTRPGILVLADAWYPGWEAHVDSHAARIVPIDFAFRGVELGQGTQEVVFRYAPNSLYIGGMISGLTALLVLVGMRRLSSRWR